MPGEVAGTQRATRRLVTCPNYISRWPLLGDVIKVLAAGKHITWAVSGHLSMALEP